MKYVVYKSSERVAAWLLILLCLLGASVAIIPKPVKALSGSDFNAAHIIDDSIFTNSSAMSVNDIQNFLNAKVGSCDNNGTRPSSHWDSAANRYYTDGEWASMNGQSSTFTCINQYIENTSTGQNNFGSYGTNVPGGISAAQIIWNAAQAYQINPEVIITTIQKEQGLITDYWPWLYEYQYAMGYSCPDSGGCSSSYADFYKQVDGAAWQFRYYLGHLNSFNYGLGNNYILYNPSSSCGGSTVNIQNAATAALYIYTPYQPNQAALNNLNGAGDSCSSYGNRNFWVYFNEWFGSSIVPTDITNQIPYQNRVKTITLNGQIYTFYYDAYQRVLKLATQNNTTGQWQISTLDGDSSLGSGRATADVGSDIAVTTYKGTIQLFYYDATYKNLRHAWLDSGTWHFEDLDGNTSSVSHSTDSVGVNPSVTVTADNSLQLFYYDKTYGALRHAWTDANGWHFENLDGNSGAISHSTANVGLTSTVTTLGNSIQLYYYNSSINSLRHAWTDANGWHFEDLDGGSSGSISHFAGPVGLSPTVINYNGSLQLYYYNYNYGHASALRHAWTDANGWHFEDLDGGSSGSISHFAGPVGLSPTVINYNGSLQLYYYNASNGSLRHTWTDANGWHFEDLDGGSSGSVSKGSDNVGLNSSATVLNGNSIQLYYYDSTSGALRHAWTDANGWHFEDLDSVVIY